MTSTSFHKAHLIFLESVSFFSNRNNFFLQNNHKIPIESQLTLHYFSRYIFSTDQISLPDWLYFLRYLDIFMLQLFVAQSVTS